MQIDLYQVDAFTKDVFGGNPAAVCPLDTWLHDETLINIAAENNLSETAFFIPSNNDNADFELRWFTPTVEMDLCGHATLASAFCIFEHIGFEKEVIRFNSRSGILEVKKTDTGYVLNFPQWVEQPLKYTKEELEKALGLNILETYQSSKTFVIIESPEQVKTYVPDIAKIKCLKETLGIVITAQGDDKTDFVSRLFAPQIGIDEDPVTGAIHCFLTPYWAKKLGKTTLNAKQLSTRGGDLLCTLKGDRVEISGNAVLYLKGTINV